MSGKAANPRTAPSAPVHPVDLDHAVDPETASSTHPAATGSTADLEARYQRLVLDRVDNQGPDEDSQVESGAADLACRLAEHLAEAQDLVEVHVDVLRRLTEGTDTTRSAALLDAGEHVLLVTLGHLSDEQRRRR